MGLKADIKLSDLTPERLSCPSSKPILAQMLAYALSSNTWWAVTFLVAVSVITMLGMMAKILRYELLLIKVVSSARIMRTKHQHGIDEEERENNPEAAEASDALKEAKAESEDDEQQYNADSIDVTSNNDDSDTESTDEFSDNVEETENSESPDTEAIAA